MGRMVTILGIAILLFFSLGCTKKSDESPASQAETLSQEVQKNVNQSMQEASKQMAEAMQKMNKAMSGNKKVKTVDFRELKKLLPEKVDGLTRQNASGERTSAFGINVSQAEGNYSNDAGASLDIKIIDMGSLSGPVAMAAASWAMADFERETDTGFERTLTYKGHKAYEKYDSGDNEYQMNVLVADRFLIEINGYNIDQKTGRQAIDQIDLGKLEKWKDYGKESEE